MTTQISTQPALRLSTLILITTASALCAGSNYFNQPLLHAFQAHFAVSAAQAQLTVTCSQLSYAMALFLLVPLGDILNRHRFIPLLMLLAGLGMLISGCAQNIYMLWFGAIFTGIFSVAAQVLLPYATLLVAPEKTGTVIGFVMMGVFIGILLSTTLAGSLSYYISWQAVYLLSAGCIFLLTAVLQPRLLHLPPDNIKYLSMLASMWQLLRSEARLRLRIAVGGCAFGSFSVLFATLALYLSAPPYQLSEMHIGLIGLTGVLGAICSHYVGRWADRGWGASLSIAGISFIILGWLGCYASTWSFALLLIGYSLINIGVCILHIINLNVIFRLRQDARSRINSIYMSIYFAAAALASTLGIWAWNHGTWPLTCLTGLALASISAIFVLIDWLKYGN